MVSAALETPSPSSRYDPMASTLPVVTSCTWHQFGQGGGREVIPVGWKIFQQKIYLNK